MKGDWRIGLSDEKKSEGRSSWDKSSRSWGVSSLCESVKEDLRRALSGRGGEFIGSSWYVRKLRPWVDRIDEAELCMGGRDGWGVCQHRSTRVYTPLHPKLTVINGVAGIGIVELEGVSSIERPLLPVAPRVLRASRLLDREMSLTVSVRPRRYSAGL
jgi:hypothetical protein